MSSDFLNTSFYDDLKETSDTKLIRVAFGDVFEPIRNTCDPEEHEIVLLYYSGRGNEAQTDKSSSPFLPKDQFAEDRIQEYSDVEEKFFTSEQRVKGGELCLNDVGYCDLQDLLVPWIAALTAESKNTGPKATKRNKHLVVIADSCYSGMLVKDLMKLAFKDGPWNQNGCTVTVQSAASSQENTLDGHFTPCFVHFNQRENRTFANLLINEWNVKSETEKDAYNYEELPSPQLASTMLFSKDEAAFELNIQDSKLRLFHDARFFKFYFLSFSGILGNKGHALTTDEATTFLSQQNFKILDYKLKTMPSRTTPVALVLVDDPKDKDRVVCVHFHIRSSDADFEKINGLSFIHHK